MLRLFLIVFIGLHLCFYIYSRTPYKVAYSFKHLNTNDGLSQSIVVDAVQDGDGFIWFGTFNGVNRYDGNTFKVYKDIDDPVQLASYFIRKLYVDSYNNLWVATNNGLGRYDKHLDKIININYLTGSTTELLQVEDIFDDENGHLWFCSSTGLYRYTYKNNSFEIITPRNVIQFPYLNINAIVMKKNGDIVLTALNELFLLNTRTFEIKKIANLNQVGNIQEQEDDVPQRIIIDTDDNVWIGTFLGHVYKYNTNKETVTKLDLPDSPIFNDIYQETDSTILISLDYAGLFRYYIKEDIYERLYDIGNKKKEIVNNKVRSIFIDKQNILWLGHYQGGISYANLSESGFKSIVYNDLEGGLTFPVVSAMLKDSKGNLWIGTDGGGIIKFTPDFEDTVYYAYDKNDKTSLPNNAVLAIYEDRDSVVWIGSYRGGVTKYVEKYDGFISYQYDAENLYSISSNDVREIAEDSSGKFWLVTHGNGVSVFDKTTERFVNYKSTEDPNSVLNDWTFDLCVDFDDNVWITCSRGVSKFDQKNNQFINFEYNPQNEKGLINNLVYSCFCDSNGDMWFGTDQGLDKYNKEENVFEHHSSSGGLPANTIGSIEEDHEGNLWVSTGDGLYKYNDSNKTAKRYTQEDGLQGNEFIGNSSFCSAAGELYFGGSNGLSYFNPEQILTNNIPPNVELLKIELYGKELPKAKLFEQNIKLNYNENFLSFYFVALNFINQEKNQYKYKLEGLDHEWKHVDKERKAVYTSIPPGNYIFKVIASNNDGVWNDTGINYSFSILAPWWSTWWFRISSILFLLSITFVYYFNRIRNIKAQNILLERKVKERTAELFEANSFLEDKNTEIEQQNSILHEKQEKIEKQHKRLLIQQEEIMQVNEELKTINNQLAENEAQLLSSNEQLTELINTKDKMLSIIAHDLKNPMNTLIGFSSLMKGKIAEYSTEKIEKYIDLINNASNHAYELLENLLTWARSQTGSIKIEKKANDLNLIIKENVELLNEVALRKEINLISKVNNSEPNIACVDYNTVSTILRNLISNSIKFTNQQGKIEVFVDYINESTIVLNVEDNGVGMTEEQQRKLFKIEKNNSTIGTKKERGTGLGLVICKEFAELNNGRIMVESEKGKGTIFKVLLPIS